MQSGLPPNTRRPAGKLTIVDSSAASMVATAVRKAIVHGELSSGEQIRQAEWAELLRVSRVPVREALKSLASEGILRHDHNRGYFVVRFGSSEVTQIYMLRRMVESELISTIEWPSRQRVARIRGIAEQVAASMLDTNRNMDRWNELDHRGSIPTWWMHSSYAIRQDESLDHSQRRSAEALYVRVLQHRAPRQVSRGRPRENISLNGVRA